MMWERRARFLIEAAADGFSTPDGWYRNSGHANEETWQLIDGWIAMDAKGRQ